MWILIWKVGRIKILNDKDTWTRYWKVIDDENKIGNRAVWQTKW